VTLRELVAELVAIDSVNPELVPGGAGELEIARFIAGWLEHVGVEAQIDVIAPGRANVIGVARGSGGGRTLLLNGHTDTVGHDGYERPLEPRVEGDRLYGRGSFDMKGGVAAAMWAAAAAVRLELPGDVVISAVCDEEFASIGTQAIAGTVHADAAIVTEPTALEVCVAHKGFAWLEVEIAGRAAHGSQPQLGVDAIAKAGRVLTGIEDLGRRLAGEPGHALLGPGSVHASLITGGQELSSYPERCLVELERRTVPGEGQDVVEQQVRKLVEDAAAADPGLRAEVRTRLVRPPFEIGTDAEIVRLVRSHAERVCGRTPAVIGWAAWMDSAILAQAEIPTVIFGPGGEGAHAVVEWVDLASVEQCAEVLVAAAREFCAWQPGTGVSARAAG
jgi:acetylornithine deacetylase